MRSQGIKKLLCMILPLCVLLLSSCSGNDSVSDISAASPVSSDTFAGDGASAEQSDNSDSGKASETESKNTETEFDFQTVSVSEGTLTGISESVSAESETSPPETTQTVFGTESSPAEAESKNTETVSKNTEISTEMTTVPAAEVIIPEIKTPLASGTDVLTAETAEVDFGNASDGYISAVYKGKSAQAKLRIKCGDLQYDHDLAADGTREFFPLMGSGSYTVKIYEQVSGKNYAEILSGSFEASIKNETLTYLYPNKYVNFGNGSNCVKKAAEVCAGAGDDVDRIAAIFEYVADNISYDKELAATVQSGYIPDPDSTLASGKGICFDYASLFAAMCRSQGIPARLVVGYAEPNIYHAWNEVYTEETGWITPELFLKKKGYNIADATFYAGNSDKEKIAAYISDDGNYSAMYRY